MVGDEDETLDRDLLTLMRCCLHEANSNSSCALSCSQSSTLLLAAKCIPEEMVPSSCFPPSLRVLASWSVVWGLGLGVSF